MSGVIFRVAFLLIKQVHTKEQDFLPELFDYLLGV